MSMLVKKRFEFVDIVKGICILLIIRGHINYSFFPEWVNENEFYTIWYVSGFYLIGGFFLKEADLLNPKNLLKKKIPALYLKSLYFFLPATLLHNYLLQIGYYPASIKPFITLSDWGRALGKVFMGMSFEKLVEPLWFALALFYGLVFLSIMAYGLKSINKYSHMNMFIVSLIACAISGYISNYTDIHFPPRIATAVSSTVLISLGYLIFNSSYKSFNNKCIFVISLVILLSYTYTIGAAPGMLIGMIVNEYPDIITLLVGTLAGVYFICYLSCYLEHSVLGVILAHCGKESFYLMALHIMFIRLLAILLSKYPVCGISIDDFTFNTNFIGFFILFFGSIVLTFISITLVRRIKRLICKIG